MDPITHINIEWREMTGGRGPEVNQVGLDVLTRMFSGPSDELNDFLDRYPIDAPDVDFPNLNVTAARPVPKGGGMHEVEVEFVGLRSNKIPRVVVNSRLSPITSKVKGIVNYDLYTYEYPTTPPFDPTSNILLDQQVGVDFEITYLAPTLIFTYITKTIPLVPIYMSSPQALALLDREVLVFDSKDTFNMRPYNIHGNLFTNINSVLNVVKTYDASEKYLALGGLDSQQKGQWYEVTETIEVRLREPAEGE